MQFNMNPFEHQPNDSVLRKIKIQTGQKKNSPQALVLAQSSRFSISQASETNSSNAYLSAKARDRKGPTFWH